MSAATLPDQQHQPIAVDVVVVGGGIAGLFTLAKLQQAGYRAVLLEKSALGSGQTGYSQGIIHGGSKYALLGKKTAAQQRIAGMPKYWRACLAGRGDIDLSACRVLADRQLMWALPTLSSAVSGFFAGRSMQSRVQKLTADKLPLSLQHPACKGQFYALDEPVLDVVSLLRVFAEGCGRSIITDCTVTVSKDNNDNDNDGTTLITASTEQQQWQFKARKLIFTAGEGNADYTEHQQIRPLHMLTAVVPKEFGRLYVHVLEASDKPRLTITSYAHPDDERLLVWCIGGNIAEKGVNYSREQQIEQARRELSAVFSWQDWGAVAIDSFRINRAEGSCDGKRPVAPTIVEQDDYLLAWPTKLALAPMLAEQLCQKITALLPPSDNEPQWRDQFSGTRHIAKDSIKRRDDATPHRIINNATVAKKAEQFFAFPPPRVADYPVPPQTDTKV